MQQITHMNAQQYCVPAAPGAEKVYGCKSLDGSVEPRIIAIPIVAWMINPMASFDKATPVHIGGAEFNEWDTLTSGIRPSGSSLIRMMDPRTGESLWVTDKQFCGISRSYIINLGKHDDDDE